MLADHALVRVQDHTDMTNKHNHDVSRISLNLNRQILFWTISHELPVIGDPISDEVHIFMQLPKPVHVLVTTL